jgi:acid phosphatase
VRIPENVSTIVDLFDTKGISWRGYFEAIPGPGYMGANSTGDGGHNYVRKHNPFISYDSVNHNGSRLSNILSFTDFQHDLSASSLPQYAHMSPDMQNDGHDSSLGFAAAWSKGFLAPLLSNDYFMKDTLVLLTYDESETYSLPNKIVSILLGGAVPANLKGTTDDTFYTHYSILSTLENNWELPNLGRYDVGANVFKVVADKTGYQNQQVDTSKVDLSVSYSGYLNSGAYLPIPPPNLKLIGAGGNGVVAEVMNQWQSTAQEPTPYDGSGKVYDGASPPVYGVQKANSSPSPATTSTGSAASATTTPSPTKSSGEMSSM